MDCIIEQVFSFCFYTIHLPPAEEGEFLLYYVKEEFAAGKIDALKEKSSSGGFESKFLLYWAKWSV